MSAPQELVELAAELAREAGELARRRRAEGVHLAATKSSLADIVTDADREVEELIRGRLRDARPADGFFGEESDAETGESGVTWIVDPIDGTVNYAYGIPSYCVSIAAVEGGTNPDEWRALAGAIFAPALGELFTAARGEGSWLDGRRLQVSEPTGAGALLATGFGYDPATHEGDLATVRRAMTMARDLRRAGAAALDLAYVAAGRLDGFFERGLKPWDLAAGSLLVSEAGGSVSRFDVDTERPMLVAGSAPVHDRLTMLLREQS
ncbi:inositol monophosphatase family protein [Microbacterium sp. XT11]|uniref:inositol monophosphatase family protein n=1 Tax=Microbacterium sp. XT11 TaxID=367477 RepID=UPI00082F83AA|nr:inositol monophosphatase family protein [Microbacterium sp. XT11]